MKHKISPRWNPEYPNEALERWQMNQDPLKKLNKSQTRRLSHLLEITPEDNQAYYDQINNPEINAVERFLSKN